MEQSNRAYGTPNTEGLLSVSLMAAMFYLFLHERSCTFLVVDNSCSGSLSVTR